jgi:hypothetical protein
MKYAIALMKVMGIWGCGWFVLALLMGMKPQMAFASALGSLILPFGLLLIWSAWEDAVSPRRRSWGQDIDGQDGNQ